MVDSLTRSSRVAHGFVDICGGKPIRKLCRELNLGNDTVGELCELWDQDRDQARVLSLKKSTSPSTHLHTHTHAHARAYGIFLMGVQVERALRAVFRKVST